jgi:DNA-binding transcriptional ArsR family regulator
MAPVPPQFAIGAVLATRRRLLAAADALLPPWAALFDRSMGMLRTHVLATLAELGVPAALAERPLALGELAARVGAHEDTLHRVLRMAELDGIVRRDRRGRYRLTRMGGALSDDVLGPWVRYLVLESTRAAYAELPGSVRSGEPGFRRARGTTVWDWYGDHPEEEALFAHAMRNITAFDSADLAAAGIWPDEGTLCDVAGGTGELLSAVVARRPALRGVLVDLPGVLGAARERLAGAERIDFAAGDLFGGIDVAADVYCLKNILHDWDDATCGRILATVVAAMRPGARLVVVEQVQERDEPHPFASPTDLQMLTQTDGGRERSVPEMQALLRGAGLEPGRVERAGISALVEGVRG